MIIAANISPIGWLAFYLSTPSQVLMSREIFNGWWLGGEGESKGINNHKF